MYWSVIKDNLGQPLVSTSLTLISYISFLSHWQLFDGNTNDNGVKMNNFSYPIVARYIRLNPQRWHGLIALRMELFGCEYRRFLSRSKHITTTTTFLGPFIAHFDGTSWIDMRLDLPGRATQTAVDEVRFRFRTREINGLILYGDSSQHDYFCIELYR